MPQSCPEPGTNKATESGFVTVQGRRMAVCAGILRRHERTGPMFGWTESDDTDSGTQDEFVAPDGMLITGQSGFTAGTQVASERGWCPVEDLKVGDRVLTFDHGMQTVMDIQRERIHLPALPSPRRYWPMLVPAGALFNNRPMWLMPEQGMLVESDAAEDVLGDPFAVVPARMLDGLRGIAPADPGPQISVTTLAFARDQVIYLEGGMLAMCPHPEPVWGSGAASGRLYEPVDGAQARYVVDSLIRGGSALALASNPTELPGFQEAPAAGGRPI